MGREGDRESRSGHARQRTQAHLRGRDDGARRAGRHDRAGQASPDKLARYGDAGPRPSPAREGALVHRDGVLGGLDVDVGRWAEPREQRSQLTRPPGEGYPGAKLARRGDGTGDDLIRSVVATHGVDRDHLVHLGLQDQGHAPTASSPPGSTSAGWAGGADTASAGRLSVPLDLVSRMPPSFSLHRLGRVAL